MHKVENIQEHKHLFWDTNIDNIDLEKHSRFIIERVVMRGNISDWKWMRQIYSKEIISRKIVEIRYLDQKTLSFLSVIYKIPKEQFRCYS
jgi:hypothetical protein